MNDYIDYENIIVDPDEIRFWFEDRSDDDEDEEEEEEEIMSDNNITLEINCPFCGNKTEIVVDADAYKRYQDGALAQVAFPNLNLDDRETLISGLCKKCQKDMFG